jgi:carbon monoxide dehydrogenase subunit G
VVLGTALLILGGFAALVCLGFRPGASTAASEIVIARPPDVVWAWLTEPARLTRWVGWLTAVKQDSTSADGVGSRQSWTLHDPSAGQDVVVFSTVTEQDAPRLRRVHVRTPGMFSGDFTYTLEAVEGGTRLQQSAHYRYDVWFARLMEPLVTPQARRKAREDQARLKQLAEAEPVAGADSLTR